MAERDEIISEGTRQGFSTRQMQFLVDNFALSPHGHEIEDVEGLPQVLSTLGIDSDEEEEEDENENGE
jgi:hypothetical protein